MSHLVVQALDTGQGTQSTDTGRYNRANQSMVGNNWELRKECFEHIIIIMFANNNKRPKQTYSVHEYIDI